MTANIASALVKLLTPEQVAAIIDATLCANDDERLTNIEALAATMLFDVLCAASPLALWIAQHGTREGYLEWKAMGF